jgi:hypothetical protein
MFCEQPAQKPAIHVKPPTPGVCSHDDAWMQLFPLLRWQLWLLQIDTPLHWPPLVQASPALPLT